jgi:putative endonuclease
VENPVWLIRKSGGVFGESISVYYVYILQSLKTGKLYIGHTDNLTRRLEEHNTSRGGKYTRQNSPWTLVYRESHPDKVSAVRRERHLKSTRGSIEKKKLAGVLK